MRRAGGCLRLCFYSDKATPRDGLRPDHAGSFEALYWTILDFPQWVRTRGVLKWFRFAYCLEQDLEDAEASISVVMKHVLKVSFKPDRDPMDHGLFVNEPQSCSAQTVQACSHITSTSVQWLNLRSLHGSQSSPVFSRIVTKIRWVHSPVLTPQAVLLRPLPVYTRIAFLLHRHLHRSHRVRHRHLHRHSQQVRNGTWTGSTPSLRLHPVMVQPVHQVTWPTVWRQTTTGYAIADIFFVMGGRRGGVLSTR